MEIGSQEHSPFEAEKDGTSQERWKRNGGNNGKEDAGEFVRKIEWGES